jgi:hypothetical protein
VSLALSLHAAVPPADGFRARAGEDAARAIDRHPVDRHARRSRSRTRALDPRSVRTRSERRGDLTAFGVNHRRI